MGQRWCRLLEREREVVRKRSSERGRTRDRMSKVAREIVGKRLLELGRSKEIVQSLPSSEPTMLVRVRIRDRTRKSQGIGRSGRRCTGGADCRKEAAAKKRVVIKSASI